MPGRLFVVPLTLFSSACLAQSAPPAGPLDRTAGAVAAPRALVAPAERHAAAQPAAAVSDIPLAPPPAREPAGPRSEPLACGLSNPMPGGFTAGYRADTGLDIAGMNLPVFAIADGTVEYAEAGHTLWTGPGDTDRAIRIRLDEPLAIGDRRVTHVWYAHMNELAFEQAETSREQRRVQAGEYLGTNGKANGMWHLHLGLLLDGDTSQHGGTFLLEDEVRAVLCGMRAKQRLPLGKPATRT